MRGVNDEVKRAREQKEQNWRELEAYINSIEEERATAKLQDLYRYYSEGYVGVVIGVTKTGICRVV